MRILIPALLFVSCLLSSVVLIALGSHQPIMTVYSSLPFTVLIIMLVRYYVFDRVLRPYMGNVTAIAKWRIAVTMVVFWGGLFLIFIVLATSGDYRSAELTLYGRPEGGGGSGSLWALFGMGTVGSAVALPEYLYIKGRGAADDSQVPAWLAGLTSILTAAFIFTLHYGGGVPRTNLQNVPIGVWSIAAFGVAVLLAPFYRVVVKLCIHRGIVAVFDPALWWKAWCAAYREITGASAAARIGDDTEESPRGLPNCTEDLDDTGAARRAAGGPPKAEPAADAGPGAPP
jgi:hypothetical protein